jgi:hypothetical protein
MQATHLRFAQFTGLAAPKAVTAAAPQPAAAYGRSGEIRGALRLLICTNAQPGRARVTMACSRDALCGPGAGVPNRLSVEARSATRREQTAKRHRRVRGKVGRRPSRFGPARRGRPMMAPLPPRSPAPALTPRAPPAG